MDTGTRAILWGLIGLSVVKGMVYVAFALVSPGVGTQNASTSAPARVRIELSSRPAETVVPKSR